MLDHGAATSLQYELLAIILVVNPYLYVATKKVEEVCVGT